MARGPGARAPNQRYRAQSAAAASLNACMTGMLPVSAPHMRATSTWTYGEWATLNPLLTAGYFPAFSCFLLDLCLTVPRHTPASSADAARLAQLQKGGQLSKEDSDCSNPSKRLWNLQRIGDVVTKLCFDPACAVEEAKTVESAEAQKIAEHP